MNRARRLRYKALVVGADILAAVAALYLSYLIRFDFAIWPEYQPQMASLLPVFVLARVAFVYYNGGYGFIWRYTGLSDLLRVARAIAFGSVFLAVVNYFRNYNLAILMSSGLFLSVLAHRGVVRATGRPLQRLIAVGVVVGSVVVLGVGLVAFTVLSSAPVTIASLPFGEYLSEQDFQSQLSMPRSVLVLEGILSFLLVGGIRVTPRLAEMLRLRGARLRGGRRALIFGAGDVGESLVRVLQTQRSLGYFVTGFVDDDEGKQRASIHGVQVLGRSDDLGRLLDEKRVQDLLIAIPALSGAALRDIASLCWARGVTVRRVPPLAMLISGEHGVQNLETIDIQDLLGRVEVDLDPERVGRSLWDRVILVTGAGGSIGSELCRQIARCRPSLLLMMGKGENSIYAIEKELAAKSPGLSVTTIIGDIANAERVAHVCERYSPSVVFHAAAYKHVPFMEEAPDESVRNNVFGTRTVARAALRHGAEKFVMISSDKAVHPSSVMGATKRVAEMVLQQMAGEGGTTEFVTVRFGNVLRSRGSVIPLFEKQIEAGGPVTVTHPEMTRFFMSIPEAVRLVLHAGVIGRSGDVCILDMGKPVRIVELAENMITLSGKRPYEDVDIVFTGVRPGEKLEEELLTEEEAATMRQVDKILVCRGSGRNWSEFEEELEGLRRAAEACRGDEVLERLHEMLPDYVCPEAAPLPESSVV